MSQPAETADPEALVAGTLCLMSCSNAAAAPVFARRIVSNLEKLAAHPALALELRVVCRRLAAQWEQRLSALGPVDGPSPLH